MKRSMLVFSLVGLFALLACGREASESTVSADSSATFFAKAAPTPGPSPTPAPTPGPTPGPTPEPSPAPEPGTPGCPPSHGHYGEFCCGTSPNNYCLDGLTCNARSLTCM